MATMLATNNADIFRMCLSIRKPQLQAYRGAPACVSSTGFQDLFHFHADCPRDTLVLPVTGVDAPSIPYGILLRIPLISSVENARSVCVRTLPCAPRDSPNAVMVASSGASKVTTKS